VGCRAIHDVVSVDFVFSFLGVSRHEEFKATTKQICHKKNSELRKSNYPWHLSNTFFSFSASAALAIGETNVTLLLMLTIAIVQKIALPRVAVFRFLRLICIPGAIFVGNWPKIKISWPENTQLTN
jgi:hypothetical protein